MDRNEVLAYLSIVDNELSKLEVERGTLVKEEEASKQKLAVEDKKLSTLQRTLEVREQEVKKLQALIENETHQFAQREKQLREMGGAKSAKHLGAENDRATLVIDGLGKQIVVAKEQASGSETDYLKAEEAFGVLKQRTELRAAEIKNRLQQMQSRKKQLEEQRTPKVALLPPELAPTYDKLRLKYPDPVTTIDDGTCATCYTSIPLRLSNAVKSGEPQSCPGCHRFLVASLVISSPEQTEDLI